jgi:hypothetical protein
MFLAVSSDKTRVLARHDATAVGLDLARTRRLPRCSESISYVRVQQTKSGRRSNVARDPAPDTEPGDPWDGANDERTRSVRTPQPLFREGEARWE